MRTLFLKRKRIVDAVRAAEKDTSGEIRVHIRAKVKNPDIYAAAVEKFNSLGMAATKERNGVLFFIARGDRRFAIIGDKGINDKVPPDFWGRIAGGMSEYFKKGDFLEGIEWGVLSAGQALKEYFPYRKDDKNELSDDVSFD